MGPELLVEPAMSLPESDLAESNLETCRGHRHHRQEMRWVALPGQRNPATLSGDCLRTAARSVALLISTASGRRCSSRNKAWPLESR